ncbi:hypothetical protein PM082_005690 [Marasmius tenuissimus]|nr:hypothetical protein PM082_005690 [Marasmius tenuissimus]
MCYWRRVHNIYTKCGHGIALPEEESTANLVRPIHATVVHRNVHKHAGNTASFLSNIPRILTAFVLRVLPSNVRSSARP